MPSTLFLSRLIGLFLLIVSVAMFMHAQQFILLTTALMQNRPLMLVVAMIGLAVGLALVLLHNIWSGGALPVTITIIGWLCIIRSLLLLWLTPVSTLAIFEMLNFKSLFYFYALVPLALGAYLTYSGFKDSRLKEWL